MSEQDKRDPAPSKLNTRDCDQSDHQDAHDRAEEYKRRIEKALERYAKRVKERR